MKESIKTLLQTGCSIKFPHKEKINSWYGEVSIGKLTSRRLSGKQASYVIQPAFTEIHDIDDAVDYFMNIAFSPKNIGYIQNRLKDKGIEFDDYDLEKPTEKIKNLFKEESLIVEEEFKKFNIKVKKLSKKKAFQEFESIIKNFDNFEEFNSDLDLFIKEYSRLDLFIPVNFEYLLKNGKTFMNGTSVDELTSARIEGSKNVTIFTDNSGIEKLLNITIGIKIGQDETKRYKVWESQ